MPFPNKSSQFKKGQSGNPLGNALDRHSTRTIDEWVNQLLNDEKFTIQYLESGEIKHYKGAPIKAIIETQMRLALQHTDPVVKTKSADLLFKHGAPRKHEIDLTSNGETVGQPVDANMLSQFIQTVQNDTKR